MKYYTKKEAANLLNISIKSLDRHLKKYYTNVSKSVQRDNKNRIIVGQDVLDDFVQVRQKSVQVSKPETLPNESQNNLSNEIEILKKDKARLTTIVDEQREQLKEKDKIIEDNRQDFKILTSKIVEQQNAILLLQQNTTENKPTDTPKKNTATTTYPNDNNNNGSTVLVWFLVFIITIMAIIITLFIIE